MNEDIVAAMERERLGGMPRWNVRDPRIDVAARLFGDEPLATVTPLKRKPSKARRRHAS